MSVYILLNKYLYETLAISCKNIEYGLYIFPFACNADRGRCVYGLFGLLYALLPTLFNPYSPPSLIIFVRFCCGLFATVVFPFWQLARFVYLCLFKSNAEPAWLALPCLALAWLALPVLGLLKPSASLVCRLCHETLAPDGAEQNSWHWSWPEVGEHGPQPEYFISALCYSLCAHITQTRLNFCNFSLHSHKYILMLILFQKISQPKLVRSRFPTAFRFQSSATAAAEALAYFHY